MTRPLIYVDIDGVLNRYLMSPAEARARGYVTVKREVDMRIYTLHLDPADTARLTSLTDLGDLALGTTWQGRAPSVGSVIGLPDNMPIAYQPKMSEYRKGAWMVAHAKDRPFVWFDDQATDADRELIVAHEPGALIVDVDPWAGLTDANIAAARTWLEGRAR